MARRDYSEEPDFYSQDFELKGVVSVWIGMEGSAESDDGDLDVLQDWCGVGYYRLSDQEVGNFGFVPTSLRSLLEPLSYSGSYVDAVIEAAEKRGVFLAKWITVQYDFQYDPAKVSRPIAADPIFIGSFSYSTE